MKRSIVLFLVTVCLLGSAPVGEAHVCNWAESKEWRVSAPGKLTRGIINTGLGWTNLFVQPFKGDSVMNGVGAGLSECMVRTMQGLGEILLFWLPPVPEEPLTECVFYDWGIMEK